MGYTLTHQKQFMFIIVKIVKKKENIMNDNPSNQLYNTVKDNDIRSIPHDTYYPTIESKRPLLGGLGYLEALSGYHMVKVTEPWFTYMKDRKTGRYILNANAVDKGEYLVQFLDIRPPYYPNPWRYMSMSDVKKDFNIINKGLPSSINDYFEIETFNSDTMKLIHQLNQRLIKKIKIERERIENNPRSRFRKIYLTEEELTLVEEIERKTYVTVSKSK